MKNMAFPVIDPEATGRNIRRLRLARSLSVRDLQQYFGFEEPQAIYKWQKGKSLPTIDNLYALSHLLGVSMEEILVARPHIILTEQQARPCCSSSFMIPQKLPFVIEPLVHSKMKGLPRDAADPFCFCGHSSGLWIRAEDRGRRTLYSS